MYLVLNLSLRDITTSSDFWILVAVCPSDDIIIVMASFIVQLFKKEKEAGTVLDVVEMLQVLDCVLNYVFDFEVYKLFAELLLSLFPLIMSEISSWRFLDICA